MQSLGDAPNRLYLWPGRAVYIEVGYDGVRHAHLASEYGVGLDGELTVSTVTAAPCACWGFLVAPDVPHRVSTAGVRGVYAWSESFNVSRLLKTGFSSLTPETAEVLAKETLWRLDSLNAQGVDRLLLQAAGETAQDVPSLDARVEAALEALRDPDLQHHDRPFEVLAAHAGLSHSRLRHLVHGQTGVSLQRHLLWQRLLVALRESGRGNSLTYSAHAAGFADSAHFSRVFRAAFGLKPSQIFASHSVQVILKLE